MSQLKMLGNNTMIMNQATMIVALQLYLESIYKDGMAPHVSSVSYSAKHGDCFEVHLVESTTGV